MRGGWRVAVVMPARNEEGQIEAAICSVPEWVDLLVVIDDCSDDNTAQLANSVLPRNGVIVTTEGLGVGGAIARGYAEIICRIDENLVPSGDWAAVVMAGDGQMDPIDIDTLLEPLSRVPFVKGDRWAHSDGLGGMPQNRRIGSWILSKLTTIASGRKVSDPQCGYTAVSVDEIRKWDWISKWDGYGYPNWWLLNIGEDSIPFESVPVRSIYRNEKSGIKVPLFLTKISLLLFSGLWKRGWNWYVRGIGKTPISSRLAVSATWFSSLFLLLSIPVLIIFQPDMVWMFIAVLGFLAVTYRLDQLEVLRRLNS
tara:strand:- start:53 stop:985 length:933 start_codon:yes stop_codon:yes gene_type:complete